MCEDLDYAEAISRLSLQLAGLEASQQSFCTDTEFVSVSISCRVHSPQR